MRFLSCLILLGVLSDVCMAETMYPPPDWVEKPSVLASPDAYPGGEMSHWASQMPNSLNYYLDITVTSSRIFSSMYEVLLSANEITLELEPNLAKSWSMSDDQMSFTFYLDERAQWSDGKPITAHDVAWTFEAILKPENLTGSHKITLEKFHPPEVIDDYTIKFTAKEKHWINLIGIGNFHILPKHAYDSLDFNKINFDFPVVSGAYRMDELKEGIYLTLERRDDWWQRKFIRNQGLANFQTIRFKFYAERENGLEAFKTGEIDYYPVYTSSFWAEEAVGKAYDNNWIVKQKVHNFNPIGFQGFAMNMRREKFKDRRVRLALAHLVDRQKLNQTLMYNAYFMHQCYYEDLYNETHKCQGPMIDFNKEKAITLLDEAGWEANKQTGLLEKEGQTFVINMLTRDSSVDKYLVDFRESLKDVGIEFNIVRKDWAAWVKDMDEYNYDMTWAAWSASVYRNPESSWYSKEAERPSGQNITGFKNEKVDELILKQRTEFNISRRNNILREIDGIVSNEIPYILLWNINNTRLLYWNKFGMPDSILGKFNDEEGAFAYWWYDEDAEADLEYAIEQNRALPQRPSEVHFEQVFQP